MSQLDKMTKMKRPQWNKKGGIFMVKVSLKDGSVLEVEKGTSILEVARKISEGLARVATCGEDTFWIHSEFHQFITDISAYRL